MDLYIQAMPVGTYRVQSPGFPKIVYYLKRRDSREVVCASVGIARLLQSFGTPSLLHMVGPHVVFSTYRLSVIITEREYGIRNIRKFYSVRP